jgi:hypothetical protein
MAIVFVHDAEQRRLAEAARDRIEKQRGQPVRTEIRDAGTFWRAEDYHQKYYLRQHRDLAKEFNARYPRALDLVDSTAAARVNGYLGGNGDSQQLATELDRLGLSPAGVAALRRSVR